MPGDAKTPFMLLRPCHGRRNCASLQHSSIPLRARSIPPRLWNLQGRDISGGIDVSYAGTELVLHKDTFLMLHWQIAVIRQGGARGCAGTAQDPPAGQ